MTNSLKHSTLESSKRGIRISFRYTMPFTFYCIKLLNEIPMVMDIFFCFTLLCFTFQSMNGLWTQLVIKVERSRVSRSEFYRISIDILLEALITMVMNVSNYRNVVLTILSAAIRPCRLGLKLLNLKFMESLKFKFTKPLKFKFKLFKIVKIWNLLNR